MFCANIMGVYDESNKATINRSCVTIGNSYFFYTPNTTSNNNITYSCVGLINYMLLVTVPMLYRSNSKSPAIDFNNK